MVETVGVVRAGDSNNVICEANLPTVYEAFFNAMSDYTLDSRGDVGAWYVTHALNVMKNVRPDFRIFHQKAMFHKVLC